MPDIRTMPDGLGNYKGNLTIDRKNPNLPANRYILRRPRSGIESALPAGLRMVDRHEPIPTASVAPRNLRALPYGLKQQNAGGDRNIQRRDLARQWQGDDRIAGRLHPRTHA